MLVARFLSVDLLAQLNPEEYTRKIRMKCVMATVVVPCYSIFILFSKRENPVCNPGGIEWILR